MGPPRARKTTLLLLVAYELASQQCMSNAVVVLFLQALVLTVPMMWSNLLQHPSALHSAHACALHLAFCVDLNSCVLIPRSPHFTASMHPILTLVRTLHCTHLVAHFSGAGGAAYNTNCLGPSSSSWSVLFAHISTARCTACQMMEKLINP